MRRLVGWLLVVALVGCSSDMPLEIVSDDAQVPSDLGVPTDLPLTPRRDLYQPPDLLPRPDLLGPVPPLRFAPPLYQGGTTSGFARSAVGDFNNDGKLDVATVGANELAVTLQRPGGWMTSIDMPFTFVGDSGHNHLAIADFDGDGNVDAAVYPEKGNTGAILLGLGDGRFREGTPFTAGMFVSAFVAHDLDGDRKPDLVAANTLDNTVTVLRGKGDGKFAPAATYKSVVERPVGVTVADVNGDGKLDLAMAHEGGDVTLLTGVGDGTFKPPVNYPSGPSASRLAAADFDGDGRADLVVASWLQVRPMMSTENGLVGGTVIPLPGARDPPVVTGDWNGDGKADFAVVVPPEQFDAPAVAIPFLGDGKGGFARGADAPSLGDTLVRSVLAADIDGDNHSDLLVTDASHVSTLLHNDGAGRFGSARLVPTCSGEGDVVAADLDEDGLPDIVAPLKTGATFHLSVLPSAGGGRYRDGILTAIPHNHHLGVGAVDGDLHGDVVGISVFGASSTSFWPGNGNGTFGAPVPSPTRLDAFSAPVLGDLDGDGWLDIAAIAGDSLFLFFGDSKGGFRPGPSFPVGKTLIAPILGDWNGDRQLDVAVASTDLSKAFVLFSQGQGAFAVPQAVASDFTPVALTAADFDSDGPLDLLIAGDGESATLLRGKPGGGFAPGVELTLGFAKTTSVVSADLNGDLRPDLAMVANQRLAVFAGNGDGTFQWQLGMATFQYRASLHAADVDGDGDIDLITSSSYGPWLGTWLNQSK